MFTACFSDKGCVALLSGGHDGRACLAAYSHTVARRVQVLLATAAGRAELATWPQYGGGAVNADASGRPHVHLNVLCYYLVRTSDTCKLQSELSNFHWVLEKFGPVWPHEISLAMRQKAWNRPFLHPVRLLHFDPNFDDIAVASCTHWFKCRHQSSHGSST